MNPLACDSTDPAFVEAPVAPGLRPHVLLLTVSLLVGGAETLVYGLALGLLSRGWRVTVVSMMPPTAFVEELEDAGATVHSLGMSPGRLNLSGIAQFMRLLLTHRFDLIHSHMFHANLLARLARASGIAPNVVCTVHNITEAKRGKSTARLRELAYVLTNRWCHATIAISDRVAQRYFDDGILLPARTHVIVNGVDPDKFLRSPMDRGILRRELRSPDAFLWLSVGRLEFQKDFPNLLTAFARVAASEPNAHLWIAGTGSLHAELLTLIRTLGLSNRVEILGARTDIVALLSACDGFVLASRFEGLPVAILEAASCECPIVATAVGGNGEILHSGAGRLCPSEDSEALATSMLSLMRTSETERRRMGALARQGVIEEFSLEATVRRYESLYREAAPCVF
ncbi:MAG: glycosyltransferase [Bryobacteraceae bacterium]